MSFEKALEEKREKERLRNNVVKRNCVNNAEEVYYVGSLDVLDPYSGKPIYNPLKHETESTDSNDNDISSTNEESLSSSDSSNGTDVFDSSKMDDEELRIANEIYQRLMNEAAADEMAKQAEIDAIRSQQEESESAFNKTTGSYSGLYGKKPMSQSESDALASIMSSNSSYTKSFDELLAESDKK